jgi:hypothetical protein
VVHLGFRPRDVGRQCGEERCRDDERQDMWCGVRYDEVFSLAFLHAHEIRVGEEVLDYRWSSGPCLAGPPEASTI